MTNSWNGSSMRRRKAKVADIVASDIVNDIIARDIPAGSMLLPEHEMLVQHGVGRGTLREALHYLEIQGVITVRPGPGGGPMVATPGAQHLATTVGLLLAMSRTPFHHIVEARLVLEPVIARMAAERITDDLLQRLHASVDRMRGSINDSVYWNENTTFHELIAIASENEVFRLTLLSLHDLIDGTAVGVTYSARRRAAVLRAHEEIADAISAHDGDRAESGMRRHIEEWVRYLNKHHSETLNRPVAWR